MKFGKVDNPEVIDFTLPKDHSGTKNILNKYKDDSVPEFYIGCSNWNKTNLKGFYPRGTKDELTYYSRQFNSIELNACFYRIFPANTFEGWYNKTPDNFKFFPKLNQEISHWKRLKDTDEVVEHYLNNASNLKDKLGCFFLQMHNNFAPKDFDRVVSFVESWPKEFPLAIEFRHADWFNNDAIANELYQLLEEHEIVNVLVDTAGRRDLMHMRLTNHSAFIRFVAANHPCDYNRLNSWVDRLKDWSDQGIKNVYIFIHQHIEKDTPLLSTYFIEALNNSQGTDIFVPRKANDEPATLF